MTLRAAVALRLGSLDLDVDLEAGEEEVVALLGPNGAGKTSLLRALAGLLPIRAGRVVLDGTVLDDPARGVHLPTEKRPIGVVFQDYLLFPHLSVLDNVSFGLRSRGGGRAAAEATARFWLDRMKLGELATSRPAALSGGQLQRVALARALATEPRLLLLDEPLSALDASSRGEVRRELRRHLEGFRGVRLVVTHDPIEAIALADRLVILEGGRVTQSGVAAEITERPRSTYVADLVGVNLFRGTASGGLVRLAGGQEITVAGRDEGDVFAVIHPRAVAVHRARPEGSPRNVWPGRATGVELAGDRVRVRVTGRVPLVAEVTAGAVAELSLGDGGEVWVSVKATEVAVYPA